MIQPGWTILVFIQSRVAPRGAIVTYVVGARARKQQISVIRKLGGGRSVGRSVRWTPVPCLQIADFLARTSFWYLSGSASANDAVREAVGPVFGVCSAAAK